MNEKNKSTLHPIGTEPIDFSELNMDDPVVLRMYFGKKKNETKNR